MLKVTRLHGYFELVIGGDSLPEKKPHANGLQHVAHRIGVPTWRTSHIGDSAIDMATAPSSSPNSIRAWPW